MGSVEEIRYKKATLFKWQMPSNVSKVFSISDLDKICESCESVKNDEIRKLKSENAKLKKLVEFLRKEMQSLELKTAIHEKSVPLKKIVKEVTSTPEGKKAWETAWKEQNDEWADLLTKGKISRIKYYRLVNGMDQATLARKLKTAQPNIVRIERPGYNVPISTLEKLAKIFKVKKGDLLGD
ncbi:MAG: helix-turn-helix domain-containing protein [Nitrospirota bacterium]